MNHLLTKKFFALALLLACGLTGATATAQGQTAGARQNSTEAARAQPASMQVQSSDMPLMATLAGAPASRQTQPGAPLPSLPAPAQTPAPTPLPVVAPTPLPNLAPPPQPAVSPSPQLILAPTPAPPLPTPPSPVATPSAGEGQSVSPPSPQPVVVQSNAPAESSLAVPAVAPDYRATLGATL
ncbi:MAG TPA: hypothetical protein VEZ40_14730, partial [Pyrinomonadaceae bacterium]|nr:hypothetical protein [Pyrinomonadaceae bacterium]